MVSTRGSRHPSSGRPRTRSQPGHEADTSAPSRLIRAKHVGADTFECSLIFACQIIDMRVGLRLERAFRENPARPMARCRRHGQCGLLRNAPKARCCKLSYPRPQIIRMHVQRRRCGFYRHVRIAVFRDEINLASVWLPGHRQPLGCARYKSSKCISFASRHRSRRLPISCENARRSVPVSGGSTRARSG